MTREAVQRLLTSLGELLRARLTPALKALFDAADDSLFEMAEHCTDGMRQQAFFNGMRECRRQRGHLERATLARLIDRLQETRDAPRPTGADALSLVPEEELEETVAVSGMIERAESSNARALHALTQRFGFLLGDVQLSEANLPVGPARISKAFANACEPLDLAAIGELTFRKPDEMRFPATRLARAAAEAGGAASAVLNAANEIAVAAFLAGQIGFTRIAAHVETVLSCYVPPAPTSLDDVIAVSGKPSVLPPDPFLSVGVSGRMKLAEWESRSEI